jgi:tight adherence protein C
MTALATAALAAIIAWLASGWLLPTPLAQRAQRFRRAADVKARQPVLLDGLDRLVAALPPPAPERLRRAEAQARAAGWTAPEAGARLLAAGWLAPLAAGLAALLWQLPGLAAEPLRAGILIGAGALAGHFAPRLLVANLAARRRQAIAAGLPDAIDLLVICAEAGLSIDVALRRTARELAPAQPLLAAELHQTAIELGLLPNRADSFANLARRLAVPQVTALADMLVQTERFGTPLAQALRVLGAETRSTRLLRAEEQAARLPALMTVPMIAFILPPLFIVLIGPAIVNAMGG